MHHERGPGPVCGGEQTMTDHDKREALVTARVLAMIRLLITDLDNARADGTVLTYGYIQHRLRQALETAKQEVGEGEQG